MLTAGQALSAKRGLQWRIWLAVIVIAFVLLLPSLRSRMISHIPFSGWGEGHGVTITPIPITPAPAMTRLDPFVLKGAWLLESGHFRFGGYSALLPLPGNTLMAINDRGYSLTFKPEARITGGLIARSAPDAIFLQTSLDSEAATFDPLTGRKWMAWEGENAITRHDPGSAMPRLVFPNAMAQWPRHRGPEAMVRLTSGRFIVLREGFGGLDDVGIFAKQQHDGLLFPGDPVSGTSPKPFTFVGPAGFSPVDIAELPDSRVLILMRKLVWPFPAKFACSIVIADPAEIGTEHALRGTVVARLPSSLPIDNFEGMAIVPAANGQKIAVWLISDDNRALTQRTLLWHLEADSAALSRSPRRKAAVEGKRFVRELK